MKIKSLKALLGNKGKKNPGKTEKVDNNKVTNIEDAAIIRVARNITISYKYIVLTGTMWKSRYLIESDIRRCKGYVKANVTASTDILVMDSGASNTVKAKKALDYNRGGRRISPIRIVSPEAFRKALQLCGIKNP